jgi:hypothetical protein
MRKIINKIIVRRMEKKICLKELDAQQLANEIKKHAQAME